MSDERKMPLTLAALYPGRFLNAQLFNGKPVTLTIADVHHEELEGEKGKELKVILHFKETAMQLVLPKINAVCIAAMFSKSVPAWIGKRLTLYPTDKLMPMPTAKGDDRVCIRVFGSPDIAAAVAVEFKPPRRKPLLMTMRPTGRATAAQAVASAAAGPPPVPDPSGPDDAPFPGGEP